MRALLEGKQAGCTCGCNRRLSDEALHVQRACDNVSGARLHALPGRRGHRLIWQQRQVPQALSLCRQLGQQRLCLLCGHACKGE